MFMDDDVRQPVAHTTHSCSVCGATNGSLAVLDPCTHPLCSACLTSALNIVGEKDMECAVCKAKVNDFKIYKPDELTQVPQQQPEPKTQTQSIYDAYRQSFGAVPSTPDDCFQDFVDRAQGASTPVQSTLSSHKDDERTVLRIDNVPWVRRISVFFSLSNQDRRTSLHLPSRCG